ncbi:MAG TPA: peptidylprolyl isomerase [Cellvibrio sp.]|nr:peptidylprolyl isomerase [Cellvibrio sp.]
MHSSSQPFTAKWLKSTISAACLSAGLFLVQAASATTVQFQTVLGDFEVNLFDKTTPKAVANFLAYVKANAYANSIVHRSVPGFVIQGGGFKYTGELPLGTVTQNAQVPNEPVYSNLRGTIAMAKMGGQPDSATSQWFINLNDKNATDKDHKYVLDTNNGGFTVFGQVTGNGMAIVDAIAALNRFNMGGALTEIPLRNYTVTDNTNKKPVTGDHFMMIQNIVILNADPDTAAKLTPVKNTAITKKDDEGGSGSIGLISLMVLGLLALGRKSLLNRG